jgi:CRISPR system Cascade subunit CasD
VTSFLLFTLHAPLASWGEIAVGEWRGSWDRPSRSAVLGLLGAALGLLRGDAGGHDALAEGYGIAVRNDAMGNPMQDYHTMQSVSVTELRRHPAQTRAGVLAIREKQTVLSRREYRDSVLFTVAIWATATAPRWSLDALADALCRPVFSLYAGRRSNPLGLPLRPALVEAESLAGAFAQRDPLPPAEWCKRHLHFNEAGNRAPFSAAGAEYVCDVLDDFGNATVTDEVLVWGSQMLLPPNLSAN